MNKSYLNTKKLKPFRSFFCGLDSFVLKPFDCSWVKVIFDTRCDRKRKKKRQTRKSKDKQDKMQKKKKKIGRICNSRE